MKQKVSQCKEENGEGKWYEGRYVRKEKGKEKKKYTVTSRNERGKKEKQVMEKGKKR